MGCRLNKWYHIFFIKNSHRIKYNTLDFRKKFQRKKSEKYKVWDYLENL